MEGKMRIKGIVSAISNKEGRYGVKVNGLWFNGFGEAECSKDDDVEIDYEVVGKFNNVTKITGGKKSDKESKEPKQDRIDEATRLRRRTDCILKSVDVWVSGKIDRKDITGLAEELIEFVDKENK